MQKETRNHIAIQTTVYYEQMYANKKRVNINKL